jgi:hypothetical protein
MSKDELIVKAALTLNLSKKEMQYPIHLRVGLESVNVDAQPLY